ncbi:uncharacterized protein MYCFIDRAFT_207135 [Pseudocercospora fijiensis CIRAD86]|uniref:Uncharacterized protein n=1 Tax=Pseudocercospora fijiensis (strain CIRAD86) TaxID=383855 RepID=M3AHF4_PSEFD|nr:uncharacterized protein MYCFIDRAFT_207135 [Pseudocercospora fijiensis CIRAD86]EME84016.1 hypothetical protein MYCFIDRAFT_207135 [Pseudocercospora fijiensis CIRAD86]
MRMQSLLSLPMTPRTPENLKSCTGQVNATIIPPLLGLGGYCLCYGRSLRPFNISMGICFSKHGRVQDFLRHVLLLDMAHLDILLTALLLISFGDQKCGPESGGVGCVNRYAAVMPYHFHRAPVFAINITEDREVWLMGNGRISRVRWELEGIELITGR